MHNQWENKIESHYNYSVSIYTAIKSWKYHNFSDKIMHLTNHTHIYMNMLIPIKLDIYNIRIELNI